MTDLRRIFSTGTNHVWRNMLVTGASSLVIFVFLMMVSILLLMHAVLGFTLDQVTQRVDVEVYFVPEAPEEVVLSVRDILEGRSDVAEVSYTSREQALSDFEERHQDDFLTLQALEELDQNPLGASLGVQAVHPDAYEDIAASLGEEGELPQVTQSLVETITYYDNQFIIEKLDGIRENSKLIGGVIGALLIVLAIVVLLNTTRLAMHQSREEIAVMQLVGGHPRFVQGPFVVAGIWYGVAGAVLAIATLYPLTSWVGANTASFFGGLNLFDFYSVNFVWIMLILLGLGVALGVIGTLLAVQSYLRK